MRDPNWIMYMCSRSLLNIHNDLKEIDATASMICLALSKTLADRMEIPESVMHGENSIHNSHITEEIQEIIDEIRNENSCQMS